MRLLQIELKKLIGNKSFWVFSLIFLVFLPLGALLLPSIIKVNIGGVDTYPLMPVTAENSWYIISWFSSYFTMFVLAFILIYHVSNEYAYRTVRQNVIDGLSRWEFLKGKFLLLLVLAALASLYVFIVGLFGTIYFESVPHVNTSLMDTYQSLSGKEITEIEFGSTFNGIEYILAFFIQIVAYFSFATFIAFAFKKGALAIVIYFVSFIVEIIFGTQLLTAGVAKAYAYFPLRSMSLTLPNQGFEVIGTGMGAPAILEPLNLLIVGFYIFVFLFLTKLIFFKRDIS